MTRRLQLKLLALGGLSVALLISGVAIAQQSAAKKPAPKPTLGTSRSMMLGECVAYSASDVLLALKPFNEPVMVTFNRDSKLLEVGIFGSQGSVDVAKAAVESFRERAFPAIQYIAKAGYSLEIKDADVSIYYYNLANENALVLRREKGNYIVAD